MVATLKAVKFLFTAPLILLFLFVINLMTSPGHWWVQWAALGLGIAWFFSLLRVIRAVIVAGGLAALGTYLYNQKQPVDGSSVAQARCLRHGRAGPCPASRQLAPPAHHHAVSIDGTGPPEARQCAQNPEQLAFGPNGIAVALSTAESIMNRRATHHVVLSALVLVSCAEVASAQPRRRRPRQPPRRRQARMPAAPPIRRSECWLRAARS